MIAELAQKTEFALKHEMQHILYGRLKNRKVLFQDAMGSMTVEIGLRSGAILVIQRDDIYVRACPNCFAGYEYAFERHFGGMDWVNKIQKLLDDYDDVAQNLFAIEFELDY